MSMPTKSQSMNDSEWENPEFPLEVTEEEDGSLTFTWDENHPVTCVFNDWTEDDFIKMLLEQAELTLQNTQQDD